MDDVKLLERFRRERSGEAFRALVDRHAGMVYAACLRGLPGQDSLAEDAAQAVFAILARKAGTIRDGGALAGWLFRTARAVVANLRLSEARRRRREAAAAAAARRGEERDMGAEDERWTRARPHLNDAIASLGARQQQAVVLHFLEGRSQREAAALAGCSEGALKERIHYALGKLRSFFARRGVVLPAAVLAAALAAEAAPVAPTKLALACAGVAALPSKVAALAEGTMKMIFWAKVKAAVAGVLAAAAVAVGAAGVLSGGEAAPPRGRTWHVSPKELAGIPPAEQLRTISEAARKAEPGDTVLIHAGVYREAVVAEKGGTAEKPVAFEAAPGENAVVTGADRLTGLRKEEGEGNVFSAPWPHRFIGWNKTHAHPDDEYHRMIGRCEQVFVAGYPLLQVLSRDKLSRGTFFADLDAKRLYVCGRDDTDLSKDGVLVEASVRGSVWESKGDYIRLRGVRFRYAANMAQHGAAQFSGNSNVVEDCVFERMNSSGASFTGKDLVVRRCTFQDNGQLGFGAGRAHNLLFTGCTVRNNNVKGFSRGWEAGGDKLCFCRKAVLEKSVFVSNRGCGVWFDIGNEDCVVRNCLIADNEDAGIFYEISYGLHAHDNVIVGNGFAGTPGSWGAAAGICLSSSPGGVVERNLLVGNKEGFNFREQLRKTPLIDDKKERWVWNHDQVIRNNVLAFNRDAQTWGWFDVDDGRHWPAAMQEDKEKEKGRAGQDLAADYRAKNGEGAPVGLTLEKLKITFQNNCYSAQPYQGLFNWGVAWKRNRKYASLDEVRRELKFETGSQAGELRFMDFLARDFRVPPDSPAVRLGCYPKGEVPGVLLGTASR